LGSFKKPDLRSQAGEQTQSRSPTDASRYPWAMSSPEEDQVAAAVAEQERLLIEVGMDKTEKVALEPIIIQLCREVLDRFLKRPIGCVHITGPMPIFIPMHLVPPKAHCGLCISIHSATQVRGTAEDQTCDICRTQVEQITPFAIPFGPISIIGGLCERCFGSE
jgi:hypothetical protein